MNTQELNEVIWQKGRELFRTMPWRVDTRPYYVLVSEIMLQQTQVDRVIPKFEAFIAELPTIEMLARAPLSTVLRLWSGLGYNRRAKFLWEAARVVTDQYGGIIPDALEEIVKLPGVGPNTAGAIVAYSFNRPAVFVETNVRTVFFYHVFTQQVDVPDALIRQAVKKAIDIEHPREWYWAVMDYGAWLKRSGAGAINKSAHYKKQAPLKGSVREMRGRIVRHLTSGSATDEQLRTAVFADERYEQAIRALQKEAIIERKNGRYRLAR